VFNASEKLNAMHDVLLLYRLGSMEN
jgi:hypothetical protein